MRMTKYGDARVSLLMISGALVAAMTPTAARADSATFATRADFEAAAGATRVVEFATDDAGNPITDPANDVPFQFLGLSGVCFQNVHSYWNRFIYARPHAAITVDLPSDTYAFGTLLSPFYVVDGTHTITLSTGEVFQVEIDFQAPVQTFFGVVSDTPIRWVMFNYDNTFFYLDDFAITADAGPGRGCPPPPFIPVAIDIKPGSDPNSINIWDRGVIPVAIIGTADFDASSVDPATVAFGPAGAAIAHLAGHISDVNGDGLQDLLLHFSRSETGIVCGNTGAVLTGQTFAGLAVEGEDSVRPVPCE